MIQGRLVALTVFLVYAQAAYIPRAALDVNAVNGVGSQCGGTGFSGSGSCVTGSTCVIQSASYYQCLSNANLPASVSASAGTGPATPPATTKPATTSPPTTSSTTTVAATKPTTTAPVTTVRTTTTVATTSTTSARTTTSPVTTKLATTTLATTAPTTMVPVTTVRITTTSASIVLITTKPATTTVSVVTVSSKITNPSAITTTKAIVSSSSSIAAPVSSPAIKTTSIVVAPTTTAKIPTSVTTKTSSSAAATTIAASTGESLPFLGGVNLAGFDFSVYTDGYFSGEGIDPPISQIAHFASQGVNAFRIPFAWQLATPKLGGTLDPDFLCRYDAVVNAALAASTSPYVILDLHNYARWNGRIIGQGGPSNAQFASLWSQLAAHYKSEPRVVFGIMNEPHDIPNISTWANSVQAAVTAIRAAGATSQYILIPGSSWSHASSLPTGSGPALLRVTDPAGGVNKLVFDVHQYLDSDGSGQSDKCTTDNTKVFTNLIHWLKTHGRQALLTETGGGNTASCRSKLKTQLAFIKANSAQIAGFTVWSAGSFDTGYELSVTPGSNGSDNALWTSAIKPNLA